MMATSTTPTSSTIQRLDWVASGFSRRVRRLGRLVVDVHVGRKYGAPAAAGAGQPCPVTALGHYGSVVQRGHLRLLRHPRPFRRHGRRRLRGGLRRPGPHARPRSRRRLPHPLQRRRARRALRQRGDVRGLGAARACASWRSPAACPTPELAGLVEALRATDQGRLVAYPEAVSTVSSLRAAGFSVGVCSNWGWQLDPCLEEVGLLELVDAGVTSARGRRAEAAPGHLRLDPRRPGRGRSGRRVRR